MRNLFLVFLTILIFSCSNNTGDESTNSDTVEQDLITNCYQEKFEEHNLDFDHEMDLAITKLQTVGLNVKTGSMQELVEIISQMKEGSVSYVSHLDVENVISIKQRGLIQGCTKQFIYDVPNGSEIMHTLECIVLYDLNSIEKFQKEVDAAIDLIESLPETPDWLRPFSIYTIGAYYE